MPDLDHLLAERADVGDDVDVSGADVCGSVVDVFDGLLDLRERCAMLVGCIDLALLDESADDVAVVLVLLLRGELVPGRVPAEPFALRGGGRVPQLLALSPPLSSPDSPRSARARESSARGP